MSSPIDRDLKMGGITSEILWVNFTVDNAVRWMWSDFAKSEIFLMESNIAEYFMSSCCDKYAAEQQILLQQETTSSKPSNDDA